MLRPSCTATTATKLLIVPPVNVLGYASLAISLGVVVYLTLKDRVLVGWPTAAIAGATWLIAPVIAWGKMDAIGLGSPMFNFLLTLANLSVIGLTRGRPILMMDQLFEPTDQGYTAELRRRGHQAQAGYIVIGLGAAAAYILST